MQSKQRPVDIGDCGEIIVNLYGATLVENLYVVVLKRKTIYSNMHTDLKHT